MALEIQSFSIDKFSKEIPVSYFQKGYFQSQSYNEFLGYSNDDFFVPFDITSEKRAISIPRSPFGSVFSRKDDHSGFSSFLNTALGDLKKKDISSIEIHHPSPIYNHFVPRNLLLESGLELVFDDISQHIELVDDWENSIHSMQKRKLSSLRNEGFTFRKMGKDEYKTAHKFISVCRQAQGLQINIEWDHLKKLINQLTNTYDCFGVFREEKISALCISVNVTSDVAYYYLPATSPMFRDKSPMVLLIAGMVDYYRNEGFKYLDLGVSSYHGKPQETLRLFKERMGAIETNKPTLHKSI